MDRGTPARVVLDPLPHIVFLADVKGGVAPGQSAVVYDGDDVVMAGFIKWTHNK
jgi:tRNA U34 2-thiouridine synthase MnmA/TrmU